MAQNVLAAMTAEMLKEYPGLTVNLVTGIPAPDLIADGLDVVIRVGALQDSSALILNFPRLRQTNAAGAAVEQLHLQFIFQF